MLDDPSGTGGVQSRGDRRMGSWKVTIIRVNATI